MLTSLFPGQATDAVELGRFVLLDEVPGNGETWMLGHCFERLRRLGLAGVVAFSDPCRRLNRQGQPVFGGHIGTIYQAHNAVYLGRSTPRTLTLESPPVPHRSSPRQPQVRLEHASPRPTTTRSALSQADRRIR